MTCTAHQGILTNTTHSCVILACDWPMGMLVCMHRQAFLTDSPRRVSSMFTYMSMYFPLYVLLVSRPDCADRVLLSPCNTSLVRILHGEVVSPHLCDALISHCFGYDDQANQGTSLLCPLPCTVKTPYCWQLSKELLSETQTNQGYSVISIAWGPRVLSLCASRVPTKHVIHQHCS